MASIQAICKAICPMFLILNNNSRQSTTPKSSNQRKRGKGVYRECKEGAIVATGEAGLASRAQLYGQLPIFSISTRRSVNAVLGCG